MTSLALMAILLQAPQAGPAPQAAEPPPYRITGVVFGDYYNFVEHHRDDWEGQHGFWLRRVYFTYDHVLTPKVTARVRLEANSNGKLAGGTLNAYIKDASVRWNFAGRQSLTAGLQPTVAFEHVENVWGLRHIEKTPIDLYRWDSSRDMGVTLSGPLNASQTVKYAVQAGNESGTGSEVDTHKGYRASLRYEAKLGLTAEALVAQFDRPGETDRTTAQLFGAWRGTRARVGAHYGFQKRRSPLGEMDLNFLSAFGIADLTPRTLVFARVDRMADPCTDCGTNDYLPLATTNPFTFIVAGVDHTVAAGFRVSPNVEWVGYRDRDGFVTPKNDAVGRVTFSFSW